MLVGIQNDQIHGLMQVMQAGVGFPHIQDGGAKTRRIDQQRRFHFVEIKARRSLEPLLQTFTKWRCADDRIRFVP